MASTLAYHFLFLHNQLAAKLATELIKKTLRRGTEGMYVCQDHSK